MSNRRIKKFFSKDIKRGINKTANTVKITTNKAIDTIENVALKTVDTLDSVLSFNRRFNAPPVLNDYISKYGNYVITGATIYRHPLNFALTATLNVLSNSSYDKLFHLRCYFQLKDGPEIYIEKNERLSCGTGNRQSNHEQMVVSASDIPPNRTFAELIQNTQNLMGEKFYTYSSSSNNCQYFVRAIFQSNGMLRPQYEAFIKQDTESIFRNNPNLRKLANTITDIAGEVNGLMMGGEIDMTDIFEPDSQVKLRCVCCDKVVLYKNKDNHNMTKTHQRNKERMLTYS